MNLIHKFIKKSKTNLNRPFEDINQDFFKNNSIDSNMLERIDITENEFLSLGRCNNFNLSKGIWVEAIKIKFGSY